MIMPCMPWKSLLALAAILAAVSAAQQGSPFAYQGGAGYPGGAGYQGGAGYKSGAGYQGSASYQGGAGYQSGSTYQKSWYAPYTQQSAQQSAYATQQSAQQSAYATQQAAQQSAYATQQAAQQSAYATQQSPQQSTYATQQSPQQSTYATSPNQPQVTYTSGPSVDNTGSVADYNLAQKQKAILQLFVRVQQPSYYQEIVEIAQKYDLQAQVGQYNNPRVVKRFLDLYKQGTLPRGEIFNVYNDIYLDEVIALFDLFYFAKDFDTFYKTAAWARQNYNEGQFVYALSVAVLYRQDTYGLELPPLYEVYPYFYLSATDIQSFIQAKQQGYQQYTAYANFSGLYDVTNPEQIISYFTEDVGLNAYNAYSHLYNPFWLKSEKYGLPKYNRGENFYYYYQQLLAYYYLNRISTYLPEVPSFDWEENIVKPGYYPALRYQAGQNFPARPENYPLSSIKSYSISDLKALEYRIKDAIDSGYVYTKEGSKISIASQLQGINFLGNIIEGNADSVNSRYYGSYYSMLRNLFALIVDPSEKYGVPPGPIGYYETALRDPAFYIFQQYINDFFYQYKNNLPSYKSSELYFSGVAVKDVQVSDLITYFDLFDIDVSYAVNVPNAQEGSNVNYVAKIPRLNHKPFTYKVKVASQQKTNAVVRVFLGPKADVLHYNFFGDSNTQYTGQETYDLDRLRKYFVELDRFPVQLNSGENYIERSSSQFTSTVGDHTSFKQLLRQAEQGNYYIKDFDSSCGFPDRLALPIGHQDGIEYSFFVMVTPTSTESYQQYEENSDYQKTAFQPYGYGKQLSCNGLFTTIDNQPLGFPFDRQIKSFNKFYTPNMYFQDVSIYHQNTTAPGYPSGYNFPYYKTQNVASGQPYYYSY